MVEMVLTFPSLLMILCVSFPSHVIPCSVIYLFIDSYTHDNFKIYGAQVMACTFMSTNQARLVDVQSRLLINPPPPKISSIWKPLDHNSTKVPQALTVRVYNTVIIN